MTKIPTHWYNLIPVLKEHGIGLSSPLDPKTREPITLEVLTVIPRELANVELSQGRYEEDVLIEIPKAIREVYVRWRPTPLRRLQRLEKLLETPTQILAKDESVSETGSHKPNTAFVQAYYAKEEGATEVVTDTGAGQWGAALAYAAAHFGLKCTIFMTEKSYDEKPDRVAMMKRYGAQVIRSPSDITEEGRRAGMIPEQATGSLGLGISEAFEYVQNTKGAKLAMGCMSHYAVLHQTVTGQECKAEFEELGIKPDLMVGCVGGGSNFTGFIAPFVEDKITRRMQIEFLAAEAALVPSLTQGKYRYDYQDVARCMPMVEMYSLGHTFFPPAMHAGGLRYHGKTPILSKVVKEGIVSAEAFDQEAIFSAGLLYLLAEGTLPAPETAHALRAVINEAMRCKETSTPKTIVYLHSGNGAADTVGYRAFLEGKLRTA